MKLFILCISLALLASCSKNYKICDLEHYEKAWSNADLNRCI